MTLARSHSRPIVVDSVRFRYAVSRSRAAQAGLFSLNITAQAESGHGRVLKAEGLTTRDRWLDLPDAVPAQEHRVLAPRHIAAIIRLAHANGWDPAQPGAPFVLRVTQDALDA
jgi:hypothetical protein